MKMCKTIPTFFLLFTGYCVKNMRVAAEGTEVTSLSPFTSQSPQQATTGSGSATSSTAISRASLLVAGLGIFFIMFLICIIIGVWNARKSSKDSFQVTSAPSSEA